MSVLIAKEFFIQMYLSTIQPHNKFSNKKKGCSKKERIMKLNEPYRQYTNIHTHIHNTGGKRTRKGASERIFQWPAIREPLTHCWIKRGGTSQKQQQQQQYTRRWCAFVYTYFGSQSTKGSDTGFIDLLLLLLSSFLVSLFALSLTSRAPFLFACVSHFSSFSFCFDV